MNALNRRKWITQMGLGIAGLGMGGLRALAGEQAPATPGSGSGDTLRLSSNENPYGPSPMAMAAMAESTALANRYNWHLSNELLEAIALKHGVSSANVLSGAGSTGVLNLIVQYFAVQKGNYITANPTFSPWSSAAANLGLQKIAIPLNTAKQHNLTDMLNAINADTRFVYICNPNNPTGTVCDSNALLAFITEASKKTTVVIDEAYLEYAMLKSCAPLCIENKNLIVVKTFSKVYGLAGARVGYAIAHTQTITRLGEVTTWANGDISVASRMAALASLKDNAFVRQCVQLNERARNYTMEQLAILSITCISSHTNFIYFSLLHYKKDYFSQIQNNHIQGTGVFEEEGKWSRITVGTLEEMQQFIAVLNT